MPLATVVGACLGTTTTGTYIESAAGIEEGGRTGLTTLTTGILFLLALFFTPILTAIPRCAYGPALIIVGVLMMDAVRNIDFTDLTEWIPCVRRHRPDELYIQHRNWLYRGLRGVSRGQNTLR